jgi:acyl CoA:acetate/3-ketoacid CoA transferase beta subunit
MGATIYSLKGVAIVPTSNSKLMHPDPFVMNEDTVNNAVATFLIQRGFINVKRLAGRQKGIDVQAIKGAWRVVVESKGSQANHHDPDTVFDSGQLTDHLAMQILVLMRHKQKSQSRDLLVAANPDIARIRTRLQTVEQVLNELGIIRFWIQENLSVKVEAPETLRQELKELNLI